MKNSGYNYLENPQRRIFLRESLGLAKGAAIGGLAVVVASCGLGHVSEEKIFDGIIGDKRCSYTKYLQSFGFDENKSSVLLVYDGHGRLEREFLGKTNEYDRFSLKEIRVICRGNKEIFKDDGSTFFYDLIEYTNTKGITYNHTDKSDPLKSKVLKNAEIRYNELKQEYQNYLNEISKKISVGGQQIK